MQGPGDGSYDLAVLGLLFLAGWAANAVGRSLHVPRVTLLLLLGVVASPAVLDLAPNEVRDWFPFVTDMTLAIVGFLLGESFAGKDLQTHGKQALVISLFETGAVAIAVFGALYAAGASMPFALAMAGIAPASAPAATLDVIRSRKADGPLTDTVLGVVAIDDAWGVIAFSLLLVAAQSVGEQAAATSQILTGLWEVVGGVGLGALVALPMAHLTGKEERRHGKPTLLEAIGFVFLCGGIAKLIGVSYLLACITLGAVLANRAKHYTRPFHAIEDVREPFMVVFFVLAGLDFQLDKLMQVGWIAVAYVAARIAGLVFGGWIGGTVANASSVVKRRVGWCLLPQAGVALGLALLAKERLPEAQQVLPLVIASTVFFELLGPVLTLFQLNRAGEVGGGGNPAAEA